MNLIKLSEDQRKKIIEMWSALSGEYDIVTGWIESMWLEHCLYTLLPKVAEHHGKQPFTTPNWSEHMVRQKIINELPNTNPIDTLYKFQTKINPK